MDAENQRARVATALAVVSTLFTLATLPATCLGLGFVASCPAIGFSVAAILLGRSVAGSADAATVARGRVAARIGFVSGAVSVAVLLMAFVALAVVITTLEFVD